MTKSRDISAVLRDKGDRNGLVALVTELFERQAALEQQMNEVGMHLLQMTRVLDQVTTGAGMMRQQIERMQGITDEDDDLPPTAS